MDEDNENDAAEELDDIGKERLACPRCMSENDHHDDTSKKIQMHLKRRYKKKIEGEMVEIEIWWCPNCEEKTRLEDGEITD